MKKEKGMALITVLMIITIIGVLIISLSTNTVDNLKLSAVYKSSITNFYECEGVNTIEELNVVTISVSDISKPSVIKAGTSNFPGNQGVYSVRIQYGFYKSAVVPGTSLNMFNDYFYFVRTTKGKTTIRKLVSKIGPKM